MIIIFPIHAIIGAASRAERVLGDKTLWVRFDKDDPESPVQFTRDNPREGYPAWHDGGEALLEFMDEWAWKKLEGDVEHYPEAYIEGYEE